MAIIHIWLIGANCLIAIGASMLAGGRNNVRELHADLPKEKAMRAAGQSIFLAANIFLLYCIYDSIQQYKREHPDGRVHRTLYLLLATWPFLVVRGIYGVLGSVVPMFDYFSWSNYGEHGLIDSFVISEYILSTTMEWTSCALLMLTYITSRNDPKKGDLKEWENAGDVWRDNVKAI
jgi:hypothetical protein